MSGTQRIAVVTGSARGLGLETSRELAGKGIKVILTARTEAAVAAGLAGLGSADADGHVLDVSSSQSVLSFFIWLRKTHGHADILVNNAGRSFGGGGVEAADAETVEAAFVNNSLSAYRMIRAALPDMNRSGWGRIVNVSSGMGQLSDMNGGSVAYRISKTALNAVTRVAAAEAHGNVKVNSVCPGWVRTDMGGASASRSLEQGASGIVWAATLPDSGPSAGFFRDGKPIPW